MGCTVYLVNGISGCVFLYSVFKGRFWNDKKLKAEIGGSVVLNSVQDLSQCLVSGNVSI